MLQQVGEVHLLQLGRQEGVLLLQLVSCLQPLICLCAVTSHQSPVTAQPREPHTVVSGELTTHAR